MSFMGIENFDFDKSGFQKPKDYSNKIGKFILPGVFYLPEKYYMVEVNFNTGATMLNTNMQYVPNYQLPLTFVDYVEGYTNSGLKEFPGFDIRTCKEEFGENLYPACYNRLYMADNTLIEDSTHIASNFTDVLQIIQASLNPEHKSMQLFEDVMVQVPVDSLYYQQLLDKGLLIDNGVEEYMILSNDNSLELDNNYDNKFLNNMYDILPEYFELARPRNGIYYYVSFEIDGDVFRVNYGDMTMIN